MPGTPANTPYLGLPRYSDTVDTASFAAQINAIVDALDSHAAIMRPGDLTVSAAATRSGCLLCDGSAVSRSTYADLFTAIGTTYGAGDGSTTFNVPDYQGRVIIGAGAGSGLTARALGDKGGEEAHALSVGELAAHAHPGSAVGAHAHPFAAEVPAATSGWGYGQHTGGSEGLVPIDEGGGTQIGGTQSATPGLTIASQGSGTAHNNIQPFGTANVFIKT